MVWLPASSYSVLSRLGGGGTKDEEDLAEREASKHGVVITAFVVIFLAEWGDLTQILTANLAAVPRPFIGCRGVRARLVDCRGHRCRKRAGAKSIHPRIDHPQDHRGGPRGTAWLQRMVCNALSPGRRDVR